MGAEEGWGGPALWGCLSAPPSEAAGRKWSQAPHGCCPSSDSTRPLPGVGLCPHPPAWSPFPPQPPLQGGFPRAGGAGRSPPEASHPPSLSEPPLALATDSLPVPPLVPSARPRPLEGTRGCRRKGLPLQHSKGGLSTCPGISPGEFYSDVGVPRPLGSPSDSGGHPQSCLALKGYAALACAGEWSWLQLAQPLPHWRGTLCGARQDPAFWVTQHGTLECLSTWQVGTEPNFKISHHFDFRAYFLP